MTFARHLSATVLTAMADTPVVLLHGARQTGKSTLARRLAESQPGWRYITLDDAAVLAAARHNPQGFLSGFEGTLVLDEVQRAPDLFLAMKLLVDRDRQPGRFLVTGSANILLLPRLADSLAGRLEVLTLWPLSQGEMEGAREGFIDAVFADALPPYIRDGQSRPEALRRVLRGGYPAVLGRAAGERRAAWFGSYILTILQRDVRDLANIERLTALPRLLSMIATRAGGLLNFADLARSMTLAQSTLKRYMTLLETIFLVQPAPAWSANLGKRLVKSPKLYLNDTGLGADLLGFEEARLPHDPVRLGGLMENFVVMELRKQMGWNRTRAALFHFQAHQGPEVDIVLEDASGNLVGIEVKSSASVGAADFKGLKALAALAGRRFQRGVVLYTGTEAVSFEARLHALPLDALWRLAPTPKRAPDAGPGSGPGSGKARPPRPRLIERS